MDQTQLIYILIATTGLLAVIIALCGQFIGFALKFAIAKIRYKQEFGLIFYRNIGSNFTFPKIVSLKKNNVQDKDGLHPYSRDQFRDGTFWGKPFMFVDSDDVKTSYGLYKHQTDEEGHPLFYAIKDEQNKILNVPVLDAVKTSVSISPELLKTAFSAAALSQALKDFMKKNQLLLILCGAAALFAFGALFFSYNNQNSISNLCVEKFGELGRAVLTRNVSYVP